MRIVWLTLHRYRRFENASINLDAPVVALVGPNEAGKSSLLQALVDVERSGQFGDRDITSDLQPQGRVLEAMFLLDETDREILRERVPEASDVRWFVVWRNKSGERLHETSPKVPWTGEAAERTRKSLTKLRDMRWSESAPEHIIERLDVVISWLPDAERPRTYDEHELNEIENLGADLADAIDHRTPATLRVACQSIADMISDERRPRPQTVALDLLETRTPRILEFSESDRTLHTNYNLQDPGAWTNGLQNLARLAQFDLQKLADAAAGARPELRVEILRQANLQLDGVFAVRWSQSKLTVHLDVQGSRLEIYVASDEGGLYRLEDRSDGLRTYLALVAFLDNKNLTTPPILVFDEAESHLHWDAQADLINVLYDQDMVSQVVYSTHSPGCLPHDLGHGVRAIVPIAPDRSKVTNWIWEADAGFRPLLVHMGASTAAMTPHRYAVGTEGVSDFILLPSLIRAAIRADSLSYQVVPGLAQLSKGGLRSLDSESDTLVYLTDGDAGGKELLEWLENEGIPPSRLLSLPDGVALEDLVFADTLSAAIREELRRSGKEVDQALSLPEVGRSSYLDDWYQSVGVNPPSKRAVASRVLDICARRPQTESCPLLEDRYRSTLTHLHQFFMVAFGRPPVV